MGDHKRNSALHQAKSILKPSLVELDKKLDWVLKQESVQKLLNEHAIPFRNRIFTLPLTLITFVKQVLQEDISCQNIVNQVLSDRIAIGSSRCSTNTSSYCDARKRLPESLVRELVLITGKLCEDYAMSDWKFHGRDIMIPDGTILSMPDTDQNREKYPQSENQKEGCGFPLIRLVPSFSLSTGAVINYATAPYKGKGTGETALLREQLDSLKENAIIMADRYYPSFFLFCELLRRGCDGIFRGAVRNKYDFRKGQHLGPKEHIVEWKKPQKKPEWMSEDAYQAYPEILKIREFKIDGSIYVTSLLEHKKYTRKEICDLYKQRWDAETHIGSLKTIMGMNILRCKSPKMVEKEIGIFLLAYNLVRLVMIESSCLFAKKPRNLSFKNAVQIINQFIPRLYLANKDLRETMYLIMLEEISKHAVNNRPGRVEPRAVKRRPLPFPRLQMPRKIAKEKLIKKLTRKKRAA